VSKMQQRGIQPILDHLGGKFPEVPRVSQIKRCGLVFTDKVILITGGNKGLGEGVSRVFVDAGAKVMICGRDEEAGIKLANELMGKGPGECVFQRCDVSKPEEIAVVVDSAIERFGQLDCLFNNAGYHPPHKPIDDFTLEELEHVWRTNFVSQFMGCKYALPHLRKTKGSIINMGSCVAVLGQEAATTYSATKGAISAFTRSLAIEESRHGVRVNAVLPGNIYTQSRADAVKRMGAKGPEFDRWAESLQIMGRSGTSEEVGQLVLFLASQAASYLTGIEIMISGGIELGQGIKYPCVHL